MRIIPAIDILDGTCVRLTKGDFDTKQTYHQDPLEVAKLFESSGLEFLHLVDLDGARKGQAVNFKILESITRETDLKVDFSGGLKTDDDVQKAFDHGAHNLTIGSVAVQNPDLFLSWLETYGPDKMLLSADSRDGLVAIHGWQKDSSEQIVDFIKKYENQGVQQVISTDVARDGTLSGPAFGLYQAILATTNIQLIASGGVSSIQDLIDLKALGCAGVIIGKAIYERKIKLDQLIGLC